MGDIFQQIVKDMGEWENTELGKQFFSGFSELEHAQEQILDAQTRCRAAYHEHGLAKTKDTLAMVKSARAAVDSSWVEVGESWRQLHLVALAIKRELTRG